MDSDTLLIWLVCSAPVVFFLLMALSARADREKHFECTQAARSHYESALAALQQSPNDPSVRLKCLEAGRAYYELANPDTQTVAIGQYGIRPIATHDNSAGREAKINSDIEARIGHLKKAG